MKIFLLALATSAAVAAPAIKPTPLKKDEVAALQGMDKLEKCASRNVVEAQSFRLAAPGSSHDGSVFLVTECQDGPSKVQVSEFRKGAFHQSLPPHPANEWSTYEVEGITFQDVNGDGQLDVVAVVSAMTGIGPTGAEPFSVAGVWLGNADGTFRLDEGAKDKLDALKKTTLKTVLPVLKKHYGKG